jgi:hypothetical protein
MRRKKNQHATEVSECLAGELSARKDAMRRRRHGRAALEGASARHSIRRTDNPAREKGGSSAGPTGSWNRQKSITLKRNSVPTKRNHHAACQATLRLSRQRYTVVTLYGRDVATLPA